MAYLLVVLDGAADRPEAELDGLTPLEKAKTPHLDRFALEGINGEIAVLKGGRVPQTHTGVLALLGYDLEPKRLPRGPIEALGHFGKSDSLQGALCARANFATVKDSRIVSRRVCRDLTQSESEILVDHVRSEVSGAIENAFWLKSISTYRLSLVFHAGRITLCSSISNTDPGYALNADYSVPQRDKEFPIASPRALDGSPEAQETAKLVSDFSALSHVALRSHPINLERERNGAPPANYIIIRDFGIGIPEVQSFREKHGLTASYIYQLPIERGLAQLLGMEHVSPLRKDSEEAELKHLADLLLEHSEEKEFVVLHVKGPDEPAHDGDWREKRRILESIDHNLFGELEKRLDYSRNIIIVTSDHATSWSIGTHTSDRVPVLVCGGSLERDEVVRFSERDCRKGSLGISSADQLLIRVRGLHESSKKRKSTRIE